MENTTRKTRSELATLRIAHVRRRGTETKKGKSASTV
jgi:hypothetical protein